MKRRGSSGGEGATRDVEPERCRLAGTVFLGTIIVTDGSKSEKKCTQEEIGDEGTHQKLFGGNKCSWRVFIEAWKTSHFTAVKECGLLRRNPSLAAAKRASVLFTRKCGPSLAAARRALPWQTRRLTSRIFPSIVAKQASPRQTRKYGHCVFALHL